MSPSLLLLVAVLALIADALLLGVLLHDRRRYARLEAQASLDIDACQRAYRDLQYRLRHTAVRRAGHHDAPAHDPFLQPVGHDRHPR